ncbi:MAG: hypothetical protein JWR01_2740 [Subtercola sp.]|nr:hypothetical protein [Subtercola sp.]
MPDLTAFDLATVTSGTDDPRLVGSLCQNCGATYFPQRLICFECRSEALEPHLLPSTGALYAWTTVHVSSTRQTPYTVGYIDLPGGLRILSDITGPLTDDDFDAEVHLVVGDSGGWSFSARQNAGVR